MWHKRQDCSEGILMKLLSVSTRCEKYFEQSYLLKSALLILRQCSCDCSHWVIFIGKEIKWHLTTYSSSNLLQRSGTVYSAVDNVLAVYAPVPKSAEDETVPTIVRWRMSLNATEWTPQLTWQRPCLLLGRRLAPLRNSLTLMMMIINLAVFTLWSVVAQSSGINNPTLFTQRLLLGYSKPL